MLYTDPSKSIIEALIHYTHNQAKSFLDDAGEFYPFASVLDNDGKIKPFAIHEGEDYPDPSTYYDNLAKALSTSYTTYSIGINVRIKPPVYSEEMNAIQIKIVIDDQLYEDSFIPYELGDDGFIYHDLITIND